MSKQALTLLLTLVGTVSLTAGEIHDLAAAGDKLGVVKLLLADPEMYTAQDEEKLTIRQIAIRGSSLSDEVKSLNNMLEKMDRTLRKVDLLAPHYRTEAMKEFLTEQLEAMVGEEPGLTESKQATAESKEQKKPAEAAATAEGAVATAGSQVKAGAGAVAGAGWRSYFPFSWLNFHSFWALMKSKGWA